MLVELPIRLLGLFVTLFALDVYTAVIPSNSLNHGLLVPRSTNLTYAHTGSQASGDILSSRSVGLTAAWKQTAQVIEVLASQKSEIPSVADIGTLQDVEKRLGTVLRAKRGSKGRIEVFFIIYGGSNGDVPLISSVLQGMLDRPDIYDVKHAIVLGDSYRDFFPQHLREHFAKDNAQWADDTNMSRDVSVKLFIQKMEEILVTNKWNPDLIVTGHFLAPRAADREQSARIKELTSPSDSRILIELQVFYMPGIFSTALKLKDIQPNKLRIYAQQPEIWPATSPNDIGAAMIGKLPRLLSASTTVSKGRPEGEVYDWIHQQTFRMRGQTHQIPRRIFYMGLGMKEREVEKENPLPNFQDLVEDELKADSKWSFIILHNAKRATSTSGLKKQQRVTNGGRVFHLYVGETSWAVLFPLMTVVLTHGGVGSVTDAIEAGVPQIILPTSYAKDQEYFSKQLRDKKLPVGVGLSEVDMKDVWQGKRFETTPSIASAFKEVRTNLKHFRDNIAPLRQDIIHTKALDNTFQLIDRLCVGLLVRSKGKKWHEKWI